MTSTTETQDQALHFPLAIKSEVVPAAEIVVQADLRAETLDLIGSAATMLREKRAIVIASHDEYATAADELAKIKGAMKEIDERRKEITKPFDEKKKKVMDFVRPYTDALASAETLFKNGMIAFDEEQERKRQLAEAEAEEKRRKAEEALNKRAEKAEAAGHVEKADALREQAASTVVAAPVAFEAPKAKGVSSRKTYSAEVTDLLALAKAAVAQSLLADAKFDPATLIQQIQAHASHGVQIKAIQADDKFLNQMATALKDDFAYPGCKLSVNTSMAVRSK